MLIWLFIGIALLFIELLTLSFFIIFFGLAALTLAAILVFTALTLPWQIFIFSAVTLLYFALGKNLLKKKNPSTVDQDQLIGTIATVVQPIFPKDAGKVLVGDTLWNATSSVALQKGSKVRIVAVSSLTLEVTPV